MGLTLATAPTVEPVSVTDAKNYLRVSSSDEDDYIGALIRAAREFAEVYTNRQFCTATWDHYADCFPENNGEISLPRPPLASVTYVKYVDENGDTQTMSADDYDVDTDSIAGRVVPAYAKYWPTTRSEVNAVNVRFVAGYGDADDVPDSIKTAMLFLVAHWFENREPVVMSASPQQVPLTVKSLLNVYCVPVVR